jgi:hypothetical protein
MFGWIIRAIMFLAAIIASWFVSRDAVNFNVIEFVAALFIITALVAIAAFWEAMTEWVKSKKA